MALAIVRIHFHGRVFRGINEFSLRSEFWRIFGGEVRDDTRCIFSRSSPRLTIAIAIVAVESLNSAPTHRQSTFVSMRRNVEHACLRATPIRVEFSVSARRGSTRDKAGEGRREIRARAGRDAEETRLKGRFRASPCHWSSLARERFARWCPVTR